MRTTWILLAVVLLGAVGLQWAGRLAQAPARPLPALAQALPTAEACPGWTVHDEPIAASPEMQKAVGELLNYDDGLLRVYAWGGASLTVYVAAWAPGKMPQRLIAVHTPDVCWVGGGWVKQEAPEVGLRSAEVSARLGGERPRTEDALRAEDGGRRTEVGGRRSEKAERPETDAEKPALVGTSETQVSGLRSQVSSETQVSSEPPPSIDNSASARSPAFTLPLGEYREFTYGGTRQYVLFWHVVGDEIISYGTGTLPPWYAPLTDVFRHGLNQRKEQFFIRVSANRPLNELWDEPAFQAVLAALHDLALGRAR